MLTGGRGRLADGLWEHDDPCTTMSDICESPQRQSYPHDFKRQRVCEVDEVMKVCESLIPSVSGAIKYTLEKFKLEPEVFFFQFGYQSTGFVFTSKM